MKVRNVSTLMLGLMLAGISAGSAATTTYRNLVLGDSPIVYYEFDETSGTTAANSAKTGATYNGTINTAGGSVTFGQSSFAHGGTAYDFGGGFVGSASALTSSLTAWTVEAWVNYDSAKGSASNFLSNDQGGWNNDVLIGFGAESGTVGVPAFSVGVIHQDNANQTRNFVGSPLAADDWVLVVMTGENDTGLGTSTLQLYIDGVLADSDSTIPGDVTFNGIGGFGASPNLTIGAARPDSGDAGCRPYDGLLDEVAIYDYVLTPDQISAHANIPEPGSALLLSLGGLVLGLRRRGRNLG